MTNDKGGECHYQLVVAIWCYKISCHGNIP